MKICTVILTHDNPLYNHFDSIKRQYLEKNNEDFIFVYNGTDTTKHNLKNNTFNYYSDIVHPSGIPVMFEKFIDTINSGSLNDYDYVVRVNSSTFIDLKQIRQNLIDKIENIYMGFFYPNWNFVSGACSIFSKDVLKKLTENSHLVNKNQEDDTAIGSLMSQLNVPKTFLDRACFESHIQDTHITVPSVEVIKEALKQPQIRIRNNSNREVIDKGIWNIIADIVLN
jgi:hypothetical protein